MANRIALMLCVLAVVGTAEGEAFAQYVAPTASGPAPGYHSHDGFFMRFTPGLAGGASVTRVGGEDWSIAGGGFSGSLALGGALTPNWILCAETTNLFATDPTLEIDGRRTDLVDSTYSLQYLGAGASYYFPSNLYLHGGLGAMWMGFRAPDDSEATWTDAGFAFKGLLGKEWWVSHEWALGVAGQLVVGSVPDGDVNWSVAIVGLHLSATYN